MSRWPGGIFRRSYLRAYAQAIGLDPERVVRECLEFHPDPDDDTPEVLTTAQSVAGDSANRRPPTRLGFLVGSVIASLPGFGVPRVAEPRAVPAQTDVTDGPPPPDDGPHVIQPGELIAVARLCTALGCARDEHEVSRVLADAAGMLDAVGVILWAWDSESHTLSPVLAHGYADEVLAQVPRVGRDADNAIAVAFRSAQTCVVRGSDQVTGAIVTPILTPGACVGVLALELRHGGEQLEYTHALATILSAQLSAFSTPRRSLKTAQPESISATAKAAC